MKLKVLFLASWYPSRVNEVSGVFIKKHAEAIARHCDVAVLFVSEDKNMIHRKYDIEYTEEQNIKTVRVYYKPFKFLNFFRYLKASFLGLKLIRNKFGRIDICHVNVVLKSGLIAVLLRYLKKIPFIVTEHWSGYLPQDGSYKGFLKKILTRFIISKSYAITTVSKYLMDAMLAHGLVGDYYVVPNVVEIPDKKIIKQNHFNNNKSIILHISLMNDKEKNISNIIHVINEISKIRNDFEFHVIGDGKDREKLENLAHNLGILNKVVYFHGYKNQEEIYDTLSKCSFLIVNSNYETFSLVTAEAIGCGIPVIATKCGGPQEYVNENVGILIEPNNIEQLRQAIFYMLDNFSKYDKKQLTNYIREKFNKELVGTKFYDIYKEKILENYLNSFPEKLYEKNSKVYLEIIANYKNKYKSFQKDSNTFLMFNSTYDLPLISVVTPCYNAFKFLNDVAKSLSEQTISQYLQWVIVDDCSTDDTQYIINALIKQYSNISIKILKNERNMGAAYSLKKGFENADGKYIAWLSADDYYVNNDKLEKDLELLNSHYDMVFSKYSLYGKSFSKGELHITQLEKDSMDLFFNLIFSNNINGSSLVMKRNVYEVVGGIDEKLLNVDADFDLISRVIIYGYKIGLSETTVFNMVHKDQTSKKNRFYGNRDFANKK